MGRASSICDDDWDITPPANDFARTVVLVGRTGNGKSATGNSIIGRKAFTSRSSSSGVTSTCEKQKAVLHDGQVINVIDTPGLFDFSYDSGNVGKEIVKCIDMAKEGIHAVIVVFSVRTRFSQEELAALRSLQTLFGTKIVNYMVVVFTGGDELEDNDETLEDYLGRDCPTPLKEILVLCENRRVLFDNKTKSEKKRYEQVQKLLYLVDDVVSQNGGKPYMDKLFLEMKEGAKKLHDGRGEVDSMKGYSKQEITELKKQIESTYEAQLKRIAETVETKMRQTTVRLEQQLAEEQASRLKAEEVASIEQKRSNIEIARLRKQLETAQKKSTELDAELRKRPKSCSIL